ncbi:outer membrane protein [Novosphingobium sp.]|uniref:outer membrane protein n=1 Tax=Novosphingobium sp. TaxID=1874826 RepID=UPI002734F98E|nr:outer membrane protein [Novosphingobium sp.]MDP3907562.1 porin family protein [Novosphingobium sp.]
MKVVAIPAFALVAALALPGLAHAQSQPFDGPSVGVQGGWSQDKLENPETDLGVLAIDTSKDKATFGGFVGYDKSIGNFVIGTEAGFSIGTSDTVSGGPAHAVATIDPKWSLDLTARAGYLVTPKTLMYARGGYTNARLDTSLTTPAGMTSASENRDGWLVGAGVERSIMPNVSARLEYRYSDLSEGDATFDRHQVLTGITYRF